MALIDSNNFITHLVWSGLVDKATCGELKEAIELCTVKDIYTKADMVAMLTEIQLEIEELEPLEPTDDEDWQYGCFHGLELMQDKCLRLIQEKIDSLKKNKT